MIEQQRLSGAVGRAESASRRALADDDQRQSGIDFVGREITAGNQRMVEHLEKSGIDTAAICLKVFLDLSPDGFSGEIGLHERFALDSVKTSVDLTRQRIAHSPR